MKKKRTPWPRWAKVARNLLLTLLLGFLIWRMLGKPLPYNADLRRLEHQWLIPRTEHRMTVSRAIWGKDAYIDWTEGAAVISTSYRSDHFSHVMAQPFKLTDGPNLIVSPWAAYQFDKWGQPGSCALYAALQPPEDSVSAVLTLHNDDGTYTISSQRMEDVFLFYAQPETDADGRRSMGSSWFYLGRFSYELAFFDADGNLIQEIAG